MKGKGLFEKVRNTDPRIRSLFIVHTSMLIFSMGNSIIVTGIWPYLQAVSILSKVLCRTNILTVLKPMIELISIISFSWIEQLR